MILSVPLNPLAGVETKTRGGCRIARLLVCSVFNRSRCLHFTSLSARWQCFRFVLTLDGCRRFACILHTFLQAFYMRFTYTSRVKAPPRRARGGLFSLRKASNFLETNGDFESGDCLGGRDRSQGSQLLHYQFYCLYYST